jgi:Holliday junction resolvase RusA-like endonuclease
MIVFTVYGKQEPAGSKSAYVRGGHANVVDANKKAKPWKKLVRDTAELAMRGRLLYRGPLEVTFKFYRALNKGDVLADGVSLSASRRHDWYPATKPDLLKLARAIEDAMTGIIYLDDAQIVDEHLRKRFVTPGDMGGAERERVVVTVREIVH